MNSASVSLEAKVLAAFENWKVIYLLNEGYFIIPSDEAGHEVRDAIINEYINPGSEGDSTLRLEKATNRKGKGTGVYKDLRISELSLALRSLEITIEERTKD